MAMEDMSSSLLLQWVVEDGGLAEEVGRLVGSYNSFQICDESGASDGAPQQQMIPVRSGPALLCSRWSSAIQNMSGLANVRA